MAGEHLDFTCGEENPKQSKGLTRRFVGVKFACCEVYARIYINPQGNGYQGHCPRCLKKLTLKVGPGGTESRFFTAY